MNEETVAEVLKNFGELIIQRGNKFTFLGMDIELTNGGKVKIGTKEYIQEVIKMFGQDIS